MLAEQRVPAAAAGRRIGKQPGDTLMVRVVERARCPRHELHGVIAVSIDALHTGPRHQRPVVVEAFPSDAQFVGGGTDEAPVGGELEVATDGADARIRAKHRNHRLKLGAVTNESIGDRPIERRQAPRQARAALDGDHGDEDVTTLQCWSLGSGDGVPAAMTDTDREWHLGQGSLLLPTA